MQHYIHRIDRILLYCIIFLLSSFLIIFYGLLQYLLPLSVLPLTTFSYIISAGVAAYIVDKNITLLKTIIAFIPYLAFVSLAVSNQLSITPSELLTSGYGFAAGSIAITTTYFLTRHKTASSHYRPLRR